jgi:lipoic acid synthetase
VRQIVSTEVSPAKSGRTKWRNLLGPSTSLRTPYGDFSTSSRKVGTPLEMTTNNINFELLVPDFCRKASGASHPIADPNGKNYQREALEILSAALPFVFGHNLETVPRLYQTARSGANYKVSLKLLEMAKKNLPNTPTKSAIMLGLGETDDEIERVLADLRNVHCDRIAIGQYLKPSKDSLDVVEYIHPEKFDYWADRAKQLGFDWVMSSPFTRSSYNADNSKAPNS